MKKPEKRKIDTDDIRVSSYEGNMSYNKGSEEMEKYYQWLIKRDYIRKEALNEQQRINNLVLADKCDELDRFVKGLLSEEEILKIMLDTWSIDSGRDKPERFRVVAKTLSKRIGR